MGQCGSVRGLCVGSVGVCARVPVQGRGESVGDPCIELVWVSGRSLSGVSVGLWKGPVQGQCGCVGGFCLGTLGLSGVPLWGQCGSV